MPFRLRQLSRVSARFRTLGNSCKCSSNEIDLSAASKQIPAAPKCLFAMGLHGDCVNRSAFKGPCQEKFRSSIRQRRWNAAFSKTVAYVKPEKNLPPSLFFFFPFLSPPHQSSYLSAVSEHEVLCKGCVSGLQMEIPFPARCLRLGSW